MKPLIIEVFESDTGDKTFHAGLVDRYNKLSAHAVGHSYREAIEKVLDTYETKLKALPKE